MGIIDELKNYRVGTDLASWHPTICDRAADYIIVLLSRVEAAETRAEKAERERDEYFKHLKGLCFCCGHRTDGFDCNSKCYGHRRGTAWVYAGPMKEE